MRSGKSWFGDLFLTMRWYAAMGSCSALFVLAFFFPFLLTPVAIITIALLGLTVFDYTLLFFGRANISATRSTPARFSLGDDNPVRINLRSTYPFQASLLLIDELPIQFQERNWKR